MLSYRHAFHAGNHADVLKHYVLSLVLAYMKQKDKFDSTDSRDSTITRYTQRVSSGVGGCCHGCITIQHTLSTQADNTTTYTKTEVNDALSAHANQSPTNTKTEVTETLSAKG